RDALLAIAEAVQPDERVVVAEREIAAEDDARRGRRGLELLQPVPAAFVLECFDVQFDFHGQAPARVMSMIQFVSHVAPPSPENDCSHRAVPGVSCVQTKRTRTGRPSCSSSPSNVPTPPVKRPTTGGSKMPRFVEAQ